MKPGHATPEPYSPRLCRGTRGAKQRHYCSVPLHNAAQTHQLFQSQLGLRRGTAWHRIDMSLHYSFSCDCSVPAGDVSLGFWIYTFEGLTQNTNREELHWFHELRPPAPLENLAHILFGLLSPSLQKKPNPNQTQSQKPMMKDTWIEARDGPKNRQSLDTAPKQFTWWDTKRQEEMIPYDLSYRVGLFPAGQEAFHTLQTQSDTCRIFQPQSTQSSLAF